MVPNDTSGLIFIYCSPEDRLFAEELMRRLGESLVFEGLIITILDDFWPVDWPWRFWLEGPEWPYWMRWLGIRDEKKYQILWNYFEKTPPTERQAIFLFLLSPDSFGGSIGYYLRHLELGRYNAEKIRYISVLVRPIAEGIELLKNVFSTFQLLPSNGQAVTTWSNQDKAWAEVTQSICASVEDFLYGKMPVKSGSVKSSSIASLVGHLSHRLPLKISWQSLLTHFRNLRASLFLQRRAVPLILGQYAKALHDYEQALLAQPDQLDLYIGRGKALLGLKRSQEALDTFNTVLRRDPQSVEAFKGQGRAYEQLAQQVFEDLNQQAEACYEQAKQLGVEET